MSPAPFPCCRWLNQPGSLHLEVRLSSHTCCPHSPSTPAAPAHFIRHSLVFLKALLREASCLSSVLAAGSLDLDHQPMRHPRSSSKGEERIHGNASGGRSIPDARNQINVHRDVSFRLQQEYTLKREQRREEMKGGMSRLHCQRRPLWQEDIHHFMGRARRFAQCVGALALASFAPLRHRRCQFNCVETNRTQHISTLHSAC